MGMYNYEYGSKLGSMRGYHGIINRRRAKLFFKLLNPSKHDKMLEIGCNDGLLLSIMQKYCDNCTGIDVNGEMLGKSRVKNTFLMDSTNLEFEDNSFNKIYSIHVVEHVPDIRKYFEEASRVLASGGIFALMFPWELFRGMRAWSDSVADARKLHLHKLSPKKVCEIVNGLPLKLIKSGIHIGLVFPDYYMIFVKK